MQQGQNLRWPTLAFVITSAQKGNRASAQKYCFHWSAKKGKCTYTQGAKGNSSIADAKVKNNTKMQQGK
jgi:hypothetical protein